MELQSQAQLISPFLTIWLRPRATIRKIVETDPTKHVLILAALFGISEALDNASEQSVGDSLPLLAVLAMCIIFGPIGGIISLYIGGAVFRWTGSWLGGQATSEEVRAAIAWSYLPLLIASILWIPQLLIFGEEMFTSSTPRMDANPLYVIILGVSIAFITIIAAIWTFVILVKGIGEVHKFSAWRGLGAIFLGGCVFLVPILCIVGVLVIMT